MNTLTKHFSGSAASFTECLSPTAADLYSVAAIATVRELFYECALEEQAGNHSPNLLFVDEDTFLALEHWHHRFRGWDWNALRRESYGGYCALDFGYGPTELIITSPRGSNRLIELALGGTNFPF